MDEKMYGNMYNVTENCYSKYTTNHPQNLKPQIQNPFEFNPRPQNTNQIKHLEQTKEINNKKKKAKMLGPGARKDKEN